MLNIIYFVKSVFGKSYDKVRNIRSWRCKIAISLTIFWFFWISSSYAITADKIPIPSSDLDSYIIDLANILDSDSETELNRTIATLKKEKDRVVYLVSVPEITKNKNDLKTQKFKIVPEVSETRKYLNSILLNWDLEYIRQGKAVLLLVSLKDKSIEIRSSFKLRYILQDRHVQGIIDRLITPEFKQNNFEQGIVLGIKAIVSKINNPYENSIPQPQNIPWQKRILAECKARRTPNPRTGEYNNCFSKYSYHGGSGSW